MVSHGFFPSEEYMDAALEEALKAYEEEEVPIGAVAVFQNRIIAKDHNKVEQLKDPTAHAEILVIKKASEVLKSWRLLDISLYVTIEPCPMCVGAMHLARIPRLIFGAKDEKKGSAGSLYNIASDNRLNHRILVLNGIREKECRNILSEFFIRRRRKI